MDGLGYPINDEGGQDTSSLMREGAEHIHTYTYTHISALVSTLQVDVWAILSNRCANDRREGFP